METPSIDSTIGNYFSQWALSHPKIAWAIEHPLMAIGLLLLALFALAGLFKAVGRGIERSWIWLLTTPFKLIQPIFRPIWRAIGSRFGNVTNEDASGKIAAEGDRIQQIVGRLDAIHQEQETLLRELATLTKSSQLTKAIESKSTDRSTKNGIQLPKFDD